MFPLIPDKPWLPAIPETTSGPDNRDPAILLKVVNQFPVETHARYAPKPFPGGGVVPACETLIWDFTRAMSVEVPYWRNPKTQAPAAPGKGIETNANGMCAWLAKKGKTSKWYKPASAEEAQQLANEGYPVIASWMNPDPQGYGLLGILLPNGPPLTVAQAGLLRSKRAPMSQAFGQLPVVYYAHD